MVEDATSCVKGCAADVQGLEGANAGTAGLRDRGQLCNVALASMFISQRMTAAGQERLKLSQSLVELEKRVGASAASNPACCPMKGRAQQAATTGVRAGACSGGGARRDAHEGAGSAGGLT